MKDINRTLLIKQLSISLLFVLLIFMQTQVAAQVNEFQITVKTDNPGTSSTTSFTLPLTGNFDVDWENDGTFDDVGVIGSITHDYGIGMAGTYQIAVQKNAGAGGSINNISFNNTDDKDKLLSIDQWGTDAVWTTMLNAFFGCSNLTSNALDNPNLSNVTNMSLMFRGATLFNQDIGSWDVSNVINMSQVFFQASSFNHDLDSWDVTNVDNMSFMFRGATVFNGALNGWGVKTSNVTNMFQMFFLANSFNQALDSWDVSSVINMSSMFRSTTLFNQDLNSWDVSNVTNMSSMFNNAPLFNQNLTNWVVDSVTSMSAMFRGALSFNQDVGVWGFSSVTNAAQMFDNSNFSTTNYDKLLISLETQTLQSGVSFGALQTSYCIAGVERASIISVDGWVISDAGFGCPPVPGGVRTDLSLWLKADADIISSGNNVNTWGDQSDMEQDFVDAGQTPDLVVNAMNFNPGIQMNPAGNNTGWLRSSGFTNFPSTAITSITVSQTADLLDGTIFSYSDPVGSFSSDEILILTPSNLESEIRGTNSVFANDITSNQPEILVLDRLSSTGSTNVYQNGLSNVSNPTTIAVGENLTKNGTAHLGAEPDIGQTGGMGNYLDGLQSEVILYESVLSPIDRNRVNSYLALKYGITLDNSAGGIAGDYLLSDTTLVWDASLDAGYHNDVVGIVRDDAGAFLQKQSKTMDDSLTLYVGTISATNQTNGTNITNDLSSLVIGHNNGILKSDPSLPSHSEKPPTVIFRFDREWKVTNTNFDDTYSLRLEWDSGGTFNINDIVLLVDTDGDFTNAQVVLSGTFGITISLGSIIISGISTSLIPANSTRFISIGSTNLTTTLPVKYSSFVAKKQDATTQLNWTTLTEINNSYFEVQRSEDATFYKTIGTVKGNGNSNIEKNYQYIDFQPKIGTNYYRLKQVDFNGKFEYSAIKTVTFSNKLVGEVLMYPNPANNKVHIVLPKEMQTPLNISIYSSDGRMVKELEHPIFENRKLTITINDLPPGLYYVVLGANSLKLMIQE